MYVIIIWCCDSILLWGIFLRSFPFLAEAHDMSIKSNFLIFDIAITMCVSVQGVCEKYQARRRRWWWGKIAPIYHKIKRGGGGGEALGRNFRLFSSKLSSKRAQRKLSLRNVKVQNKSKCFTPWENTINF